MLSKLNKNILNITYIYIIIAFCNMPRFNDARNSNKFNPKHSFGYNKVYNSTLNRTIHYKSNIFNTPNLPQSVTKPSSSF